MTSKSVAKRGPKTPEGKLTVRFNASTHGILSLQPIVNAYQNAKDWEAHRQGMIDALSSEGGMEQLLAERVASCSWRLNSVLLFESKRIAASQEGVVESVRQVRKRELEHERIFAKEGEKVLTDVGILIEAHPENSELYDASPETPVEGEKGAWILDLAAANAVRMAAYQEGGEKPEDEEVRLLSEAMLERLPGFAEDAYLGDVDWRVGQLRELIKWVAEEAGVEPETLTVDGSTISSQEQLMEKLHTEVRYDLASKKGKAEKVQAQLLAARRRHILPTEDELAKISRYEAHLSRQVYQALHELEALQKHRSGKEAPLARVDVHT